MLTRGIGDIVKMVNFKRATMIMIAAVLAFGVLGIVPANAQNGTTSQATGTAWLGVSVTDADGGGALIGEVVAGSPAETAGLKTGDIIKAVDSTTIDTAQTLVDTIKGYAPGDEVTLSVLSGDQTSDVKVTLGTRPANVETAPYNFNFPMAPHTGMLALLGLDTTVTDNGLQINAITDNSPLADSGLQVGDVITKINGNPVLEAQPGMMFEFRTNQPVTFTVLRDGKEMDIDVTVNWLNAIPEMPMVPGQGPQGPQNPQGPQGYNYNQQQPSQLGVQFRTVTPTIAEQEGLTVEQGAQITQVFANTPAATAGLEVGDIITEVDGDAVDEEHTLADRLYAYEEGDTVTLTVMREGEFMSVDVVLGPRAVSPMGGQFRGQQGNRPYGNNMPYGNGMMPRGRGRGNNQPYWGNPNGGMWFHHNTPTNPNQAPAPETTPEATPEGPAA
jgi:S1-C subfamily serine protease